MDMLTLIVLLIAQQPRAGWQYAGRSGTLFGPLWCGQCLHRVEPRQLPMWRPATQAQCGLCDICNMAIVELDPV